VSMQVGDQSKVDTGTTEQKWKEEKKRWVSQPPRKEGGKKRLKPENNREKPPYVKKTEYRREKKSYQRGRGNCFVAETWYPGKRKESTPYRQAPRKEHNIVRKRPPKQKKKKKKKKRKKRRGGGLSGPGAGRTDSFRGKKKINFDLKLASRKRGGKSCS